MTSELNNDQTVSNNIKPKKQKESLKTIYQKNKKWFNLGFYLFILVLLLLAIARIPYVGQFLDSVIFSFIFGYSKYVIYLYLIFICLLKIFNINKKPLYSKRFLVGAFATGFLISMLLGGINLFAFANHHSINYYIYDIWYKQLFDFNKWFVFGFSDYIDAGLIGAIISNIPGIFIIILSLVLLVVLYFLVFNQHRKKVMLKMFKKWAERNEINVSLIKEFQNEQQAKSKTSTKHHQENKMLAFKKQEAFNLSDNYIENDINPHTIVSLLNACFKQNKIISSEIQVKENDQEFVFIFSLDDSQLDKFKQLKNELSKVFDKYEYATLITDNTIYIKVMKITNTINPLLKTYLDLRIQEQNQYSLCLDQNFKPLYESLNNNNIKCLVSNKENLYLEYLNALFAHLSINYNKQYLQIAYLNATEQNHQLIKTQNTINQKIDNFSLIHKFLMLLKQKNEAIEKLYKQYNVESLDELNNKQNEIFKKYFIVIDGINNIMRKDKSLFDLIKEIAKTAYRYNVTLILVDHSREIDSKAIINYDEIININFENKNNIVYYKEALYDLNKKQKYQVNLIKMKASELNIVQNKLLSIYKNFNQ